MPLFQLNLERRIEVMMIRAEHGGAAVDRFTQLGHNDPTDDLYVVDVASPEYIEATGHDAATIKGYVEALPLEQWLQPEGQIPAGD